MERGYETKNYYELFRIARTAPLSEIKAAYVELARVYHPDSNFYSEILGGGVEDESLRVFQTLTNAYNTLSNQKKRAEYDAKLGPELNLRGWETEDPVDSFHGNLRESGLDRAMSSKKTSVVYGTFGKPPPLRAQSEPKKEPQVEKPREVIREGVCEVLMRRILGALRVGVRR